MMGQALARRVIGRDAKTHVIGQFDRLLIAEASAPTRRWSAGRWDIRLRDHAKHQRRGRLAAGTFSIGRAGNADRREHRPLLAGTRAQLDDYDACSASIAPARSRW
jgi:voltage-gated potassium channel